MWFLAKRFTLSLEDAFFDKPKGGGGGGGQGKFTPPPGPMDPRIRFSFKLYDLFLVINSIYEDLISKSEH